MKYSDEQMKAIEEYAELLFSAGDIAIMIEVNQDEFIKEIHSNTSECYKEFNKGKLHAEIIIRKSIIELAEAGSSPAQNLLLKMKEELDLKMINENS